MPYTITIADVNGTNPTGASDDEITMVIALLASADDCMTAKDVPDDVGKIIKIYAARHLLSLGMFNGAGAITQQSSASGASRTMKGWTQGKGLNATAFGGMVAQLDRWGCVSKLLASDAGLFLGSVGPSRG
jgi:hypothetical protein